LQLSVKIKCQVYLFILIIKDLIYEAAQNCYPDYQQGFPGGREVSSGDI
jgi:hypothetical protein